MKKKILVSLTETLAQADLVITTFGTLAAELEGRAGGGGEKGGATEGQGAKRKRESSRASKKFLSSDFVCSKYTRPLTFSEFVLRRLSQWGTAGRGMASRGA